MYTFIDVTQILGLSGTTSQNHHRTPPHQIQKLLKLKQYRKKLLKTLFVVMKVLSMEAANV